MATKTINGVEYVTLTTPIGKVSELPPLVPHIFVNMDKNPTKYGSFVATVKNEDTNKESQHYMPAYITKHAVAGKRFIYVGLEKKSDGSGHSFHSVMWEN